MLYLRENLTSKEAGIVYEAAEKANGGKDLYMKGICIQGGVENANKRVYPVKEISNAVETINEQIKKGNSVLGEVDHPDDLKINLDRVSHMIESMWMDGQNGYGKLKILETPMGSLLKTMIDGVVKLESVADAVETYGILVKLLILKLSVIWHNQAPMYIVAIYEGLLNMRNGHKVLEMAQMQMATSPCTKISEKRNSFIQDLKI